MDLQPGQAILGQKVDVVFIGSCTNGRISDLRLAAAVLKDRRVADGVRVMVVPGLRGSEEARPSARASAEIFRAAGAEWREAGCSMCIAMNGDQLTPGQYAISTSNRNFEGRQGKGGRTFLASPLTAAASALAGVDHRPADAARHRGDRRPRAAADRWPSRSRRFTSAVIPLPAENVDTDQIVPARYLKMTDKEGLADALFHDWRFDEDGALREPRFVLDRPEMAGRRDPAGRRQLRRRLVARARALGARRVGHPGDPVDQLRRHLPEQRPEERPAADRRRGRARTASCSSSSAADPTVELTVDLEAQVVHLPGDEDLPFDVDPFAKKMLLAGTDEIGYLLARSAAIERLGGRPPGPRSTPGSGPPERLAGDLTGERLADARYWTRWTLPSARRPA